MSVSPILVVIRQGDSEAEQLSQGLSDSRAGPVTPCCTASNACPRHGGPWGSDFLIYADKSEMITDSPLSSLREIWRKREGDLPAKGSLQTEALLCA